MQHRGRPVQAENTIQSRPITNISDHQLAPLYERSMAAAQVVEHDRAIAAGGQQLTGVAADVPRPPGHENCLSVRRCHVGQPVQSAGSKMAISEEPKMRWGVGSIWDSS